MAPSPRHIANALSLSRIPLAMGFLIAYTPAEAGGFIAAVALLGIALVTDFVDGKIARASGTASTAGYIIDGMGDKAVYVAIFLAFENAGEINVIVAWLLVLREVFLYALRLLVEDVGMAMRELRPFTLAHAFTLRAWIALVICEAAIRLFTKLPTNEFLSVVKHGFLVAALLAGYSGMFLYVRKIHAGFAKR